MSSFIARPNPRFSTNLNQAVGDLVTTTFNVNAVPTKIPCILIIDPGTSTQEKVKVTGSGTGTITVTRNFDGKGAFTHGFNAVIVDYDSPEYIYDIADLLEANFNSDNTPQTSVLVTPAGTQTLTNKTLTSPTINTPTTSAPIITGGVSLSGNGQINETGSADHITLTPGTNKLVRFSTNYDNNGSASYQNNTVIIHGWRRIQWDGTHTYVQTAITFPFTFTVVNIAIALGGPSAQNSGITPASSALDYNLECSVFGLTTSGMSVDVRPINAAVPPNTEYGIFFYEVIGTL